MNKVAVICFLWGDWPDGKSGLAPLYVYRLFRCITHNSTLPFDFYVYVDSARYARPGPLAGLPLRPIPAEYAGFRWNLKKISMFSPAADLQEYPWVVALDLDLIILGSIDFLLEQCSDRLVTCRGAYKDAPGGSIVGFNPAADWAGSVASYLLQNGETVEAATRGSERFYYQRCVSCALMPAPDYWQDLCPGKVASFKTEPWENAHIVRFHGQPRPHEPEVMSYHILRKSWINS